MPIFCSYESLFPLSLPRFEPLMLGLSIEYCTTELLSFKLVLAELFYSYFYRFKILSRPVLFLFLGGWFGAITFSITTLDLMTLGII
jgi:hypothetical protein